MIVRLRGEIHADLGDGGSLAPLDLFYLRVWN
jgi:hypothetical protein